MPKNHTVVEGAASLVSNPQMLTVHSAAKTILEWDSFSIHPSETLHFQQPDEQAQILNRVIGNQASEILGTLTSNGSVFLINSQGIFIGPSASIETSGFLCSTLDLLNSDFVEGNSLFFQGGSDSEIINYGKIHAKNGDAILIAKKITDHGEIEAQRTALLSSSEVMIQPKGERFFLIRPKNENLEALQEETNSSYSKAITHSGKIKAHEIEERGGEIYLVARDSTIETSGNLYAENASGKGGKIHVLGEHIHLADEAFIDVSGKEGAGEILIGGDYQGKNPEIQNAQSVFVDKGVKLLANAGEHGDGGKVILWGDNATFFYGHIEAKGGDRGGDGGFAEVSGSYLDFQGLAQLSAERGKAGTLLLDPNDITISSAANSNITYEGACGAQTYCATGAGNSVLNVTTLTTQLASNSVTVTTAPGSGGNGTITVSNAITWSTTSTLTLIASRNIVINASITNTNVSTPFTAMDFTALGGGSGNTVGIAMSSGITVSSVGGDITFDGTGRGSGTIRLFGVGIDSSTLTTTDGAITITGVGGAGTDTCSGFALIHGTLSATGSGTISVDATSQGTTSFNYGLWLPFTDALVSVADGDAVLTGRKGAATGNFGRGIAVEGAVIRSTGSGNITMNGTGKGTNDSPGVYFSANSTVTLSGSGNITIVGDGGSSAVATGGSSPGVHILCPFTSSGSGSINITGSSFSTSGIADGVYISGSGAVMQSTSNGNIRIIGQGSTKATSGTCNGINIVNSASVSSNSGNISLGGVGPNVAVTNSGVSLGTTNALTSTSGNITVSGTSASSATGSHGVNVASAWTTGTSGSLNFGDTVTDGTISVTGCTGGSGSSNYGINFAAAVTTGGDITATNTIQSGTGSSCQGILVAADVTSSGGGSIAMTATSLGSGTGVHGIQLTNGDIATSGTGTITLNGTASASTTGSSYGVYFNAGTGGTISTTGSGLISVTGTVPNGATGTNYGINLATTNAITSSSGSISLTGTTGTGSTGAGSHGINLANAFNPGFSSGTPTVTFSGTSGNGTSSHGVNVGAALTTGIGNVTFSSCSSGSGSTSHGVNVSADISTTTGNITATNAITSGSGSGSMGFYSNATISTSGSGSINIRSTSSGSGAAAYGLLISGAGSIFQTGTGTITLDGTPGAGTAYGILLESGSTVQSVTSGSLSFNQTSTSATVAIDTSTISCGSGSNISFYSPVVLLVSNPSISDPGSGTLLFSSTVNGISAGAQDLTLSATSGNIIFSGAVGGTTRLGDISLTAGGAISAAAITASSLTQAGSASGSYTGAIDTNTATGIALTGAAISLSGAVTTTNSGPVTITNSGLLTIGSAADMTLTGAFTQNGAGAVSTAGDITISSGASNGISFATGVTLTGDIALTTSATSGNISFGSTLNGSQDLTASSGGGNITITGITGGVSRLGDISLTSTGAISAGAITAASLTQTGSASGNYSGGINTNTATGVAITGAAITISGPVVTTNSGPVTITNSGLLTIASAADMSLTAAFTQNGVGLISTGGDVTTTSGNISFATDISLTAAVLIDSSAGSGNITFSGSIDETQALTVDAGGGTVSFDQTLGGTTPLDSLAVTGGSIRTTGNQSVQTGPQTYTGPVTLLSNGIFSNSGSTATTFSSSITGNYNLTIINGGNISVGGAIGLYSVTGNGGALQITSTGGNISTSTLLTYGAAGATGGNGGNITFSCNNGSITVGGGIYSYGGIGLANAGGNGGNVILTGTGGSVSVYNIYAYGGDGVTQGGNGGLITLTPTNATTGGLPDGIIILNEDLLSSGNLVASGGNGATDGTGGAITLSASRPSPVQVATITSSLSGNDIAILGNSFAVGANEAFTTLGSLSITTDASITIGDTVALETITFLSGTNSIVLLTHGSYDILDSNGSLYATPSTHFIAGGTTPSITGTLTPSGPVNILGLGISAAAFRPSLLFGSTILNYDTEGTTPTTTPSLLTTVNPLLAVDTVYELLIADAELSDRLPIFNSFPYKRGKICSSSEKTECLKKPLPFIFPNAFRKGSD